MPDEQTWIWLDDAPENIRNHTLMRHHPRNFDEVLEDLKGPEFDWLRTAGVIDAHGEFITRDQKQREAAAIAATESPAATSLSLTAFARKFAEELLSPIDPATLVLWAAPSRLKHAAGRPRGGVFSPRFPEFVPKRHEPYLPAIGNRGFARIAAADRKSEAHGARIRSEMILLSLIAGQTLPLSIVMPTLIHPPEEEWPIATGLFPRLWKSHESSLVEAENNKLVRDQNEPLLAPRSRLVYDFFRLATQLKLSCGTDKSTPYRALFVHGLGPIIDATREELKRR